jgi:hypothetical protein
VIKEEVVLHLLSWTLPRLLTRLIGKDCRWYKNSQASVRHPIDDGRLCLVLQYRGDTLIVVYGEPDSFPHQIAAGSIHGCHRVAHRLQQGLCQFTWMNTKCNNAFHFMATKGKASPKSRLPLSMHKLPASAFTPYIDKTGRYLAVWQASLLDSVGLSLLDQLYLGLPASVRHECPIHPNGCGEQNGPPPSLLHLERRQQCNVSSEPSSRGACLSLQGLGQAQHKKHWAAERLPNPQARTPSALLWRICLGWLGAAACFLGHSGGGLFGDHWSVLCYPLSLY